MKKYAIVAALCAVVLFACNSGKNNGNGFVIKGTVSGMSEGKVYLNIFKNNDLEVIDTMDVKEGKFEFTGSTPIPQMHYIKLGDEGFNFVQIFVENSEIELNVNIDSIDKPKVKGSASNDMFNAFLEEVTVYDNKIMDIYNQLGMAQNNGDQALSAQLESTFNSVQNEKTTFVKKYVKENNKSNVAAFIALFNLANDMEYEALDTLVNTFDTSLVKSDYLGAMKNRLDVLKKTQIGQPAPDFTLLTADDKQISLSSFKGKFVLVDFWASWCAPCRKENPANVENYKKYKAKGFEIVGITLDESKEEWQKAIQEDKLTWPQLCDFSGGASKVADMYGVKYIPFMVLIDKNGIIVAKNIRGEELKAKLAEVIK